VHRISGRIVGGVARGIVLALFSRPCVAQATATAPIARRAAIGRGMVLHYVDPGAGTPVIFVHGSLSDGGYWACPGHSAVGDAQDAAAFIRVLHRGKVVVVGHSYGALTALFLAAKHEGLIRAPVVGGTAGPISFDSSPGR
jgi:pimeloyl-ACP methyl ester carboxylesterase